MSAGLVAAGTLIAALALRAAWRAAKHRLGFKERVFTRCRLGDHDWRIAYGDERLHYGKWQCKKCPAGDRYRQRHGLVL